MVLLTVAENELRTCEWGIGAEWSIVTAGLPMRCPGLFPSWWQDWGLSTFQCLWLDHLWYVWLQLKPGQTDISDGNICTFLVRDTLFWRSFSYLYDRFLSPVLPEYTDEEDKSLHWCNVAYSFQTKIWFCIALCHVVHNVPLSFKTRKKKKTLFCWLHNILSCVDAGFDK